MKNVTILGGYMMCVSRRQVQGSTRHSISSREESIVNIVQTFAKTLSGVLLTVLVAFVKKN